MASILPVGSRWRAQVRKRGQSIAKTFKTKGAAEAWAREKEVEWFGVLAAAYAEAGDFAEAIRFQTHCVDKSPPAAKHDMESRIEAYKLGQPHRIPEKSDTRDVVTTEDASTR